MRWLTYYLPKQYFEALAKATSSSRITGRYIVKHFVRGGFAKSDAQCWLPGTKLKRTSKLLTSQPHWLRFFFHSITVPLSVLQLLVCPNLSGNPPRLHARATPPPFYFRLVVIFICPGIFVCCCTCIMQRILRLFHTPSLLFGSLLVFERVGEICFFHSDKRVKVSLGWNSKYHAWKS